MPVSCEMTTEAAEMNAGTEKSMPPTSTTSVCPAPARPRNDAATSIESTLCLVAKSVTVHVPHSNSTTSAISWTSGKRR